MLGEALTAEDDAAVLQELEELEGKEAQAEASELAAVPKVPCVPASCMRLPFCSRLRILKLQETTLILQSACGTSFCSSTCLPD